MMKSVSLIFLFLVFACTVKDKFLDDSQENKFVVDLDNLPLLPESALDTVFYVPLEVQDDALVGENPVIRFGGSDMYVTSLMSTKIIRYDMKGKVQAIIDHKGQSDKEYVALTDFFATEEGVYVYDAALSVLLEYDKDGNFKRRLKLNAERNMTNIIPYKDEYLVTRNNPEEGKKAVCVIDSDGNQKKAYLDDKFYNGGSIIRVYNQLAIRKDLAYICCLFDTNIYCYDGNTCSVKYSFDFGEKNLPSSFVKENTTNKSLAQDLYGMNNVYGFESPVFLNNWFYLGLRQGLIGMRIIVNEQTKNVYKLDSNDNLYSLSYPIWTAYNDFFVTTMRVSNILCMKEYKEKIKAEYNIRLMNINVDEESNPVVCFIRLKDDFKE